MNRQARCLIISYCKFPFTSAEMSDNITHTHKHTAPHLTDCPRPAGDQVSADFFGYLFDLAEPLVGYVYWGGRDTCKRNKVSEWSELTGPVEPIRPGTGTMGTI